MISRSEIAGPRAGVTLFETMVALAVLSLIVAVVAVAARPPSPRLQEEAAIAALVREAQDLRLRAIQEGRTVEMGSEDVCEGARPPVFYPDGSARFGPLCIGTRTLPVRPITGTLDLGT